MSQSVMARVLQRLRGTAPPPGADGLSDGQLLECFASQRDEAAFEALFQRHERMVWNTCLRVLRHASDAEDAFQATFLVLARKARSIAKRDSIGSWLYGVAYRVSLDARARAARRRSHERQASPMTEDLPADGDRAEVRQVLDEELGRLPEKYRAPLVLCYLEGKTNDEAADLLGWTRGTIAGRLSRARDLLRHRLTRRGLALSSVALGSILTQNVSSASVPTACSSSTLKVALGHATATGGASASAVALAEGVIHTMFVTRLKISVAVLMMVVLTCTGAGWLWHQAVAKTPPPALAPYVPLVLAKDPRQARADRPELVKGNTQFALDLYQKLREKEGNVFYSPYSISTALAMTWAGARGETADQMAKVLHFTLPRERLHPAAGALVRDLNGAGAGRKPNYQLSTANALWGQKDFGFRKDFVELTRTSYGAGLNEVDFAGDTESARQTINAWVEKQTQEKIKELLQKGDVKINTALVLTNAIYFKSEWETKFFKTGTRDEEFHLTTERKVKAPMMRRQEEFRYVDGDTFQMVELPFAGKELSMLVVLPKKVDGLAELEKRLTADWLAQWQKKSRASQVSVFLPRFKVIGRLELRETLTAMGMELPFDGGADFSGMSEGKLFIDNVIHQAYIDVNEEGAEAAGATAVIMDRGGPPPGEVTFRADHPFLFLVRENKSGSVLFLGRVVDPAK